ncbi:hypothetical protein V2J09_016608 [Rumex salicifolius]
MDKHVVPVATGKKEDRSEDESDESDEEDSEDDDSSDDSEVDMKKGDGANSDDSDSDSEEETPVARKKRYAFDTKTPEPKKAYTSLASCFPMGNLSRLSYILITETSMNASAANAVVMGRLPTVTSSS